MQDKTIIDMHCHILPGLDDGAQSMEESIQMACMAVENGVSVMVATPHANQKGRFDNYCTAHMQSVFEKFCWQLKARDIPLKVFPGMEIYASMDMIELIYKKRLCSLAGTSYYLVEFPFGCQQAEMDLVLRRMLQNGYIPLVAHPERYMCVQKYPDIVWNWRSMGCAVQINSGSVCGKFGLNCETTANFLIENRQVDVLGSDAHGVDWRPPEMRATWDYLEQKYGYGFAKMLLYENADMLLKNCRISR